MATVHLTAGRTSTPKCYLSDRALRGIDRSCDPFGDEDELDPTVWYRRWRFMGDDEVRHRVRRVVPPTSLLSGLEAPRPVTIAPVVATSSSITCRLTSDGLKYQS